MTCEYGLHDLRRQKCHSEQAADIGRVDVLGAGDFFEGLIVTLLKHLLPTEAARKRLQEGAIGPRS